MDKNLRTDTPRLTPAPLPVFTRLLSLDFLRGLIMVLLMIDSTGIYEYLYENTEGRAVHSFFAQLVHHPWHGLRFWDLVQPAFMFMAGTAMAYSVTRQWANGISWQKTFQKILKRCGWLFFWGVLDYAVRRNGLSFELWDVLTQLSFTTMVSFLVFRFGYATQIIICIGILLLTEALYRYTNIPAFDQPFTDQHNFGNYMDLVLMNKINGDGWVAINCLPTAVHTIAGAMVGKLLMSDSDKKIRILGITSILCIAAGYGLDWAGITPIIKRIATSSFTIVSLGWVMLFLAASYWWIDIRNHRQKLQFFTIVGMNSIFIYIFFEIVGHRWFNGYITAISNGILDWVHAADMIKAIVAAICIFSIEWYLCYFLYRKKIFFKL